MRIEVVELGAKWSLQADLLGSHNDAMVAAGLGPVCGLSWSTEHIWFESGYPTMLFPTGEAAAKYLKVHRKKLEEAPIQP